MRSHAPAPPTVRKRQKLEYVTLYYYLAPHYPTIHLLHSFTLPQPCTHNTRSLTTRMHTYTQPMDTHTQTLAAAALCSEEGIPLKSCSTVFTSSVMDTHCEIRLSRWAVPSASPHWHLIGIADETSRSCPCFSEP